jgi:hypothetical protein
MVSSRLRSIHPSNRSKFVFFLNLELLAERLGEVNFPAPGGGKRAGSGRGGPQVDGADDRIDGERNDAEHEMAFDLERASDADES